MFPSSILNLPTVAATDTMANAGAAAGNALGMVSIINQLAAEIKALETALLNGTWSSVPTGTITAFAGPIAPANYLFCDGSAQSRLTYVNLWNALSISTTGSATLGASTITGMGSTAGMEPGHPITAAGIPNGTVILTVVSNTSVTISNAVTLALTSAAITVAPWGLGDYSTTFNLPDGQGRTLVGHGTGTGLTQRSVGQTWGEEKHLLVTAELATHNHTLTDPTHTHTVSDPTHNHAISDPGHAHTYEETIQASGINSAPGTSGKINFTTGSTGASGTGIGIVAHATGISLVAHATGITLATAGSNTPHNNIQPSSGVNYIIRI